METQELLQKYAEGGRNFENINLCDRLVPNPCCDRIISSFADRDLSWQYLKAINLSNVDLSLALLEGVNLTEATLINTNLFRADLTTADLYKANLSGANLQGADLRGAELAYANLSFADLRNASLAGADLSNAILPDGTIMPEDSIMKRQKITVYLTEKSLINFKGMGVTPRSYYY
jgi:uncharacterized protein YjbI with pentapeptide repeats